MKKVISFSLWFRNSPIDKANIKQNKNMYLNGCIENLKLKKKIYTDYEFRFYVNHTVDEDSRKLIFENGGNIIDVDKLEEPLSKIPGMYWRFYPVFDTKVDLFIVRDVDSRISFKEELAVKQWETDNNQLHIMRDHPHHYYYILGGMWGYKKNNDIQVDFKNLLIKFVEERNYNFIRMDDMIFLNKIYDLCSPSITCHDNYFNITNNSEKFKISDKYRYIGEIFDENNIPVNKIRDKKVIDNYKILMKEHWSSKFWK